MDCAASHFASQDKLRECQTYFRWLQMPEASEQEQHLLWRLHRRQDGVGAVNFEDFQQLSQLSLSNEPFDSPRQQLLRKWAQLFDTAHSEISNHQLTKFYSAFTEMLFTSGNYRPFNWVYAGITRTRSSYFNDITTPHYPLTTQWTLHLTLSGKGLYEGLGHQLEVAPGDLVLIPPSATLNYRRADNAPTWDHRWIAFLPENDWLQWMDWWSNPVGVRHLQLTPQQLPQTRDLLDAVAAISHANPDFRHRLQMIRLEEFFIHAAGWQSAKITSEKDVVLKACRLIRSQFYQPLSVDQVARSCNLSGSRMAHLFKTQLGIGPMGLRDELRVMSACELLSKGVEPISKVAERVGYQDQLYFSKVFKRRVGYSPSMYRALNQR